MGKSNPRTPEACASEFKRLAESAGTTVVGEYVRLRDPIECRCACGTTIYPRPCDKTDGFRCRSCAVKHRRAGESDTEDRFRFAASESGATILGDWVNVSTHVLVRCACGVEFERRPCDVTDRVWCRGCGHKAGAMKISAEAGTEARFRALAVAAGVEILGPWDGAQKPLLCRCRCGNEFAPWPFRAQAGFGCSTCAVKSAAVTRSTRAGVEATFRKMAQERGFSVIGKWEGLRVPILCVCPSGHETLRYAAPLVYDHEIACDACERIYSKLYLALLEPAGYVKIGIAVQQRRVRMHEKRGWTILHQWEGLSTRTARATERRVLGVLRDYGFEPLPRNAVPAGDGWTETFHRDGIGIALDVLEEGGLTVPRTLRQLSCH